MIRNSTFQMSNSGCQKESEVVVKLVIPGLPSVGICETLRPVGEGEFLRVLKQVTMRG